MLVLFDIFHPQSFSRLLDVDKSVSLCILPFCIVSAVVVDPVLHLVKAGSGAYNFIFFGCGAVG